MDCPEHHRYLTSASQQVNMPSMLNTHLLLASLLLGALGAPVEVLPTESLSGEPSGEEMVASPESLGTSEIWRTILSVTDNHSNEFEAEFQNQVKYYVLEDVRVPSLPQSCPSSNFSKEACLRRLVEGLFVYSVLLKHVDKEYPSKYNATRDNCERLGSLIKNNMKHPERITQLTSSQMEQLQRDIDSPDVFQRRLRAHSILYHLRNFLLQGKRVIRKKEKSRIIMAPIGVTYPVKTETFKRNYN